MSTRSERLNEVYEHLKKFYGIHTQGAFAQAIGCSRTAMTLALNGKESSLSDRLFKSIAIAFPRAFNLDYLLTGEGSLLTFDEEAAAATLERHAGALSVNDLYANLIKETESLRLQAKDELATIRSVRSEIEQTRDILRKAVWALARVTPLSDYDVAMGDKVAEDNNIT